MQFRNALIEFQILLDSHEQLYIHICRCIQNHDNDTIKTSNTVLYEKSTPHFIERVVCERELETEQNCNILTPHSYGHNSVSFPFSWAAQPGSGGPASLGHIPHSSIFLQVQLLGAGFFLPHLTSNSSDLQLPDFLSSPGLYNCSASTFFLWASKSHSFNPSTVKIISWYSLTGCTCYLHRCISYFDSLAGSEVIMQQYC